MPEQGLVLDSLVVRLVGDVSRYIKSLDQALNHTIKTAHGIEAQVAKIAGALRLPIAVIAGASTKAFANFEQALVNATAIMEVSEDEIEDLKKAVLSLSGKTMHSPVELANAVYYLAGAGLSAKEAIAVLPRTQAFAVAGNMDLARATEFAQQSLAALGLAEGTVEEKTRNLDRVMNALAKGASLGTGTVEEFAVAMTKGAANAMKRLNISIEEGVALIAAFHKGGFKAELAGGSFLRFLNLLESQQRRNKGAFKEFGTEMFDAAGNLKPLADIVGNLEKALEGFTPEARGNIMEELGFKALQTRAAGTLTGLSGTIRDVFAKLKQEGNFLDQVMAKQMKTFTNQVKVTWNNLKIMGIGIGELLAPALLRINNFIRELIESWIALDKGTRRAIVGFVLLAVTLHPILFVASKLLTVAILPLSLAFRGLAVAAIALVNPFAMLRLIWALSFGPTSLLIFTLLKIGAVIAVLIHRTGGLSGAWDLLVKGLTDLWAWLLPVRDALASLVSTTVIYLWNALVELGEHTIHQFEELLKFLGLADTDWGKLATRIRDGFVDAIHLAEATVRGFYVVAQVAWDELKKGLEGLTDTIVKLTITTYSWLNSTANSYGTSLVAILALAAAAYGLWRAFLLVSAVAAILRINFVINIALMTAWIVVVNAAKLAMKSWIVVSFLTRAAVVAWSAAVAASVVVVTSAVVIAAALKAAWTALFASIILVRGAILTTIVFLKSLNYLLILQRVALIGLYTVALIGYGAYLLIVSVFTLLTAILTISNIKWAAQTILVGIATAAIFVYKIALAALNAIWALLNINITLASIQTVLWNAAVLIGTTVTWLWNAALAVLNSQLLLGAIVTAVPAIILLVAAMTAAVFISWGLAIVLGTIVGTISGVVAGIGALITVFGKLPTTFGPIGHLLELFNEWYVIISKIVEVARVDMKAAGEIMAAAFELAIAEIRALWEPMWTFIRDGFFVLWELVTSVFELSFLQATNNVKSNMLIAIGDVAKSVIGIFESFAPMSGIFATGIFDNINKGLEESIKKGNTAAAVGRAAALEIAGAKLKKLSEDFEVIEPTVDIRKARNKMDNLLHEFERNKEKKTPEEAAAAEIEKLKKQMAKAGGDAGKDYNKGLEKEVKKMDAVLFASAEAMARVTEYREKLREIFTKKTAPAGPPKPAEILPRLDFNKARNDPRNRGDLQGAEAVVVLKDMRDLLKEGRDKAVVLEEAGIA